MLSDLLTSSKGPGVIGTLLAVVVLAGFGGLMLVVSDNSKGSGLNGQIKEKEAQVKSLQARAVHWEKAAVTYKKNREVARELDSLKSKLSRTKDQLENGKQDIAEHKKKIQAVLEKHEEYKKQYRIAERARAVGEELGKLVIKDGKVYEDVSIRKIDSLGMNIRHKNGFTRIDYKLLPDEIQDRFQFSEKDAEVLEKKEQAVVEKSVEGKELYLVSRKLLDKRNLLRTKEQDLAKYRAELTSANNKLVTNQAAIETARERAAYYRSLPNRGMNWDKAKQYEQRVDSLQRSTARAKSLISANTSKISKLSGEISGLKRDISSLQREVIRLKKESKK